MFFQIHLHYHIELYFHPLFYSHHHCSNYVLHPLPLHHHQHFPSYFLLLCTTSDDFFLFQLLSGTSFHLFSLVLFVLFHPLHGLMGSISQNKSQLLFFVNKRLKNALIHFYTGNVPVNTTVCPLCNLLKLSSRYQIMSPWAINKMLL